LRTETWEEFSVNEVLSSLLRILIETLYELRSLDTVLAIYYWFLDLDRGLTEASV